MTRPERLSEEQCGRYLAHMMANVRKGVEQLADDELWRVQTGSPMSTDDARTQPYQLSHSARSLLGSAIDHLHAIGNLIEGAKTLHPMAPFTLARGAIETAAIAVWMMDPASRKERVLRRLRLAVKDASDSYTMTEPIGVSRARTREEQTAVFRRIAADAGLLPAEILKAPRSTEMVKTADSSSQSHFHVLAAWQVCSGFAHGRSWSTLSILDRQAVLDDPETGVGLYRVTSDLAHVAWAAGAGFDVLKHAADLYQRRSAAHLRPYDD